MSLMPIRVVVSWAPLASPVNEMWERGERPSAGWAERVGYQMMDHVLKTGWTPERAASFYASIGQTRSFGDVGSMSALPESEHDWAVYEYTRA